MTLALTQTATAVAVNIQASFLAVGGTEPYVYSVLSGGAGGAIDASTGVYVAPSVVSDDPTMVYDTIQVTDLTTATATAKILVGTPLILFCDILQNQLGLSNDRVYIFDQKIAQPSDAGLYIAVSVPSCRAFASNVDFDSAGNQVASINMGATLSIDAISRDTSALNRKEEILIALNSTYARQQQDANSFYVAPLPSPTSFTNLSGIDGAAIPYRYTISVRIMYTVVKTTASPYFETIDYTLTSNP